VAHLRKLWPIFEIDLAQALNRLQSLPSDRLSEKQSLARQGITERFCKPAERTEALPALVRDILFAYQRYWHAALLEGQSSIELQNTRLADELRDLLGANEKDIELLTEAARQRIESAGFFSLAGTVLPLRDLLIWRAQELKHHEIELPLRAIEVKELRLSDFVSLGWMGWGTCDYRHVGGWATSQCIMTVTPAWDLASEKYRIGMLTHEAQHFSDFKSFPKLLQPDLEYRAKLAELALSDVTSITLLSSFSSSAKRDRSIPHPFANYWIAERMREQLKTNNWTTVSSKQIRAAARAELLAHSEALNKLGAATTETALPD
jgi:hypothetical protein